LLYRGPRLPSRLAERGKIEVADDRAVAVERVVPGNGSLWTSTGPLQPDPGGESLTEAAVFLRRPQLADAGVHRRPDERVPRLGQDLTEEAGSQEHERDGDDAEHESEQVEREGERACLHDAANAGLPVHDRDRVDEDVECARPRPQ